MARGDLFEEVLTGSAIGAFCEVYNTLGYGFLEKFYVSALEYELRERGHAVAREFGIRVRYKHLELGMQRLDLVVDGRLVIEAKSTETLHKAATRQLHNYLKASTLELGLLFHFGREANFYRVACRSSSERIKRIE